MKKSILLLACAFCTVTSIFAQQKIVLQNKTKVEFYDSLQVAVNKAIAGDTLYLPYGDIPMPAELVIDKKLSIVGMGWDIESFGQGIIPNPTKLKKINFREGSNGSLITGCEIQFITFGYKWVEDGIFTHIKQDIENVTILRNRIAEGMNFGVDTKDNKVKNLFIIENVITNGAIAGYGANNCWIYNNLCKNNGTYAIGALINSQIFNNVVSQPLYFCDNLQSCIIENNFVSAPYGIGSSASNCTFNNNAFAGNISFPNGTNIGNNNLVNQKTLETFKKDDLNHPKNLEIRTTSACKNAGIDGTDIGIYGGTAPFKTTPSNPHIEKFVVSPITDKSGKLSVDIKVTAQER